MYRGLKKIVNRPGDLDALHTDLWIINNAITFGAIKYVSNWMGVNGYGSLIELEDYHRELVKQFNSEL